MLKTQEGRVVQMPEVHNQKAREAALAPLREVLEPEHLKCGKMFSIETRARMK